MDTTLVSALYPTSTNNKLCPCESRRIVMDDHIPIDVILDVLSKLPIKSLMRFKLLSHQLLTVVSYDPNFAKLQFKRSYENLNYNNNKILWSFSPSHVCSVDFEQCFGDPSALVDIYCPFTNLNTGFYFLGHCNGLLCAALGYTFEEFFIWNPCTTEFKKLPDPEIQFKDENLYGFGYVSSTDDYKVVLINYNYNEDFKCFYVYSLRSGCWRRTQGADYYIYDYNDEVDVTYNQRGCFSNGALHWLGSTWRWQDSIMAFDLEEDKFKHIPLPDVELHNGFVELFNNEGDSGESHHLCFSYDENSEYNNEIWMMKQKDCWTKLYDVSYADRNLHGNVRSIRPLCFSKDGGLIATDGFNGLLRTHPAEETIDQFVLCDEDDEDCEAIVYVESLIPPNNLGRVV